jgi:hypothetical protein
MEMIALGWFAMWMGLSSKKTSHAVLKTLLYVKVVAPFAISFVAGIVMIPMVISGVFWASQLIVSPIMVVGTYLILVVIARPKVIHGFRRFVMETGQTAVYLPPPLPARPAPPVIPGTP